MIFAVHQLTHHYNLHYFDIVSFENKSNYFQNRGFATTVLADLSKPDCNLLKACEDMPILRYKVTEAQKTPLNRFKGGFRAKL